jgi:hypothetical protein
MADEAMDRRCFLKASAASALLALAGCGNSTVPVSQSAGGSPLSWDVARFAIHPAIGFARVGNSPDSDFLAPELPGQLPDAGGSFKDAQGFLKRQAVRFRVFALDSQDRVLGEVTSAHAPITWSVHLANEKAAWYNFDTALDIPGAVATPRRNAGFQGAAREGLRIDPGVRKITGPGAAPVAFDSGRFLNQRVYLGELRTDDAGRLIVLGGRGRSFSPLGSTLETFGNNDGWCDDTSDGPVHATIQWNGQTYQADSAWVVVAPPNYGPGLAADARTLYDVIGQTMLEMGLMAERPVSFSADIAPLFLRLAGLQWVNQGIYQRYGAGSAEDLADPVFLANLSDPSPQAAALRQAWFERWRDPAYPTMQAWPDILPPIYGDGVAVPAATANNWLAVTPSQYTALARWAAGDFVDDWDPTLAQMLESVEQVPLALLPAALDRGALEPCLAAAFHPGCEVTWPVRQASMWRGLWRLRERAEPEPDYGQMLTPQVALGANGPLTATGPGGLTRWMAVPWQADTASCRSGYEPNVDPFLPTFWASRVPNQVLTEASYQRTLDRSMSASEREAAFAERAPFFRAIDASTKSQTLQNMVDHFHQLGLVAVRPGPEDQPSLPSEMLVETEYDFPADVVPQRILDGPLL